MTIVPGFSCVDALFCVSVNPLSIKTPATVNGAELTSYTALPEDVCRIARSVAIGLPLGVQLVLVLQRLPPEPIQVLVAPCAWSVNPIAVIAANSAAQ